MSWLDEALARQTAQQAGNPSPDGDQGARDSDASFAQHVRALDPLVQQLLADYGARVCGRTFRGRGYATALEAPGYKPATGGGKETRWSWHWHLHSYVRGVPGVEVHPHVDAHGAITSLELRSADAAVTCSPDEDGLKEALVQVYGAVHASRGR